MYDLGHATAELAGVAGRVAPGDLDLPTPCDGWTVRDLLVHLLDLTAHFTTVARHVAPVSGAGGVGVLPVDWFDRLTEQLDDLVDAWREPEAWHGEGEAGGIVMTNAELGVVALDEIVLHGWDLATAIGAHFAVAEDDIDAIHGFVVAFEYASDADRFGLFGPIVGDEGGRGFDRILALSGRAARTTVALAA